MNEITKIKNEVKLKQWAEMIQHRNESGFTVADWCRQNIDYLFPSYNIRFIALNDNIDTASKDSSAMDLMPVMNMFNEWHTSLSSL